MGLVVIDEQNLYDIADAIRVKNGETDLYYPQEMPEKILALCKNEITYGFTIDQSLTVPEEMVSYTDDAVGMTPFTMNLDTGIPNYGDWENAFFMPKPCMIKYDGTVDYYLDPNDYSKKVDGTASDAANPDYEGNAMMEWPVIYVSRSEDGGVISVKISNTEVDETYKCWSNINKNSDIRPFYTKIYNGSLIDGKLRSISGQTMANNINATESLQYAAANGDGWGIDLFADRMLINDLLVLMGKSTNTQAVFGSGFVTGGSSSNIKPTGTLDDKGLFYGVSDEGTPAKVFGMENYWGQLFNWLAGWMFVSGENRVKMTYGTEDGSTVEGYNTTGDGYIALPYTLSGTSGNYISKMRGTEYGLIPVTTGASATTKFCDTLYYDNSSTRFALVGGNSTNRLKAGAFYSYVSTAPSARGWDVGASPSYKPTV